MFKNANVNTVILLITIVGVLFTIASGWAQIGSNEAKIAEGEEDLLDHEKEAEETYARKDLMELQQKMILEKLDEIKAEVKK